MTLKKIKKREELKKILKKKQGKIGLTCGVFDLIHSGHTDYLKKAKKYCDCLIVSLNTDKSARELKGTHKPIVNQKDRAKILSSFEFIDFVTFHPEKSISKTIKIIKPDYYIKGGDYKKKDLESASFVESYGGKIKIIPLTKGKSTTLLVNKIIETQTFKPKKTLKPAVFLDRDGTITEDTFFDGRKEKMKLRKNTIQGLKKLMQNFYLVIITNQAGINLGMSTREEYIEYNKKMLKELSKNKVFIDRIYFCPHSKKEKCNCRKPKTGLLNKAVKELNIDLKKSYLIGDSDSDIKMAKKAGIKSIKITEKKEKTKTAKDLLEAAKIITKETKQKNEFN